ncbi:uncharacterized protein [Physcomitrium patens]|uniref:Uncharacterized protein n=1 Tax=Physcomitrium patens TaxID=3218 RepID=A9SQY4_PHYPA|nr:uncharacterized protein LOC112294211 [Physcomitrium patens]XP_024400230.1 uncharacterized protein LOC112294211 [Physcomitrium patens]XP_024400231.1 uncharacterized protein LOC112294211 [Physcomitrium patens]XP_024400232.1 uncharacterized protein LOC112294211 [Physcomitrium patens]|eukprot:XP_024400229.1 uncharacterized protein LOC112294211 [Physcomitrella patens]
MAPCVHTLCCQGRPNWQFACGLSHSKTMSISSATTPMCRLSVEGIAVTSRMIATYPLVVCFREDDAPFPEYLVERNWSDMSVRTNLEIQYSPWAIQMMNGFAEEAKQKESTGGPPGNGKGGDDGDGHGGGGGGDDDADDHIFLLPMLTLAFAAFHLGYCIAIWVKDDGLNLEFIRTGLGLFFLLAVSALRLNVETGKDAHVLGIVSSLGVMVWTGERCLIKREGSLAGVVAVFAASMAVTFTVALYQTF